MKKRATAIIICILLFINHVSAAVLYEFGNLEDAKEWVREIGTEYYEDSDYFDSYNEQLDVFYNSDDMIQTLLMEKLSSKVLESFLKAGDILIQMVFGVMGKGSIMKILGTI